MNFSIFSLDRRILAGIKDCGYETPTPIQEQAIPLVLKGHDVMGLAQTGTGKTAAFALPILQRLLTANKADRAIPRVLVLAPTRELALQIDENFNQLGKHTGFRCGAVIGGVGMNPQIHAFSHCRIIVACPGRLVRLLSKGSVSLNHIDTLVLDEADRMLDMGFMPDIKRILAKLPAKRQNLLFSATMPQDIRKLADKILVNPKTVQVANTKPVESVEHSFYATEGRLKGELLTRLLDRGEHQSVLIFTKTKHKAKNLARKLSGSGYNATFLQGNMSQNQRQRALDGFRDGRFEIMVATDIAARGIDCERISHVINFDMPDTVETYTHRIGRTGRAGRSGHAVSLVTGEDKTQVRDIERVMRVKLTRQSL
ncbi:DEAD/DEAH box helicase [Desulfovibrio sp. Huiquan2017]|uniref:DEAD/DEAH box helicase n=1 Tax=Desulfovibrio sp. Huiquan2017 TaxID=2816861 RepID=UPI001A918CE9